LGKKKTNLRNDLLKLPLPEIGHPKVTYKGLYGSAKGLAITEAIENHSGPACIVSESVGAADKLQGELQFFCPSRSIQKFPDYETLPYDAFSPPQKLLAERLESLYQLANGKCGVVIAVGAALLNRLPPRAFLLSKSMMLSVGEKLNSQATRDTLIQQGYLRVEQVKDPGEFAVRGSLLDIYPTGAPSPVRVDLCDEEIESLRIFDPHTQRTTGNVKRIRMLPAREFPFDKNAIQYFRQNFRDYFSGEPSRSSIYRDISEAHLPAGIEYYIPLFFKRTRSFLNYLPKKTLIILTEGAMDELEASWNLMQERYERLHKNPERPILSPEDAFWEPGLIKNQIKNQLTIDINPRNPPTDQGLVFPVHSTHPMGGSANLDQDPISRWLTHEPTEKTLVIASSAGRCEVTLALLLERGLKPTKVQNWAEFTDGVSPLAIAVGQLTEGLLLPESNLRIVTTQQLGIEKPEKRSRRRRSGWHAGAIISELSDLQIGAPVVHEEYGIGRYHGLENLVVDGMVTEFLQIEYAGGDKLYVPVHSLHLVSRYTGTAPDLAPLHRLGSDQWTKAKRKAAYQARDTAAELLNLYAQRAAKKGTALPLLEDAYQQFSSQFLFEETDDQLEAIQHVLSDLQSEKSMDRIICGDVGFGKTEVALRAAFAVVHAGYQVAVLVPTTLLAQQHYRTFTDRFTNWAANVELLSRFRNRKDTKKVLSGLGDGSIDIVIGTHKLLQGKAQFKRLGLAIIDEEHRFGVQHKEQLKKLRAEVDILTMTATPIPRTLNMSLGGLRDLSLIATPPVDRISVKTFVSEWSDQIIQEAVLREIRRGGQIYFVHNRVEDIEHVAEKVRKLVPEAQIKVAHGQMPEKELERIMLDFYHQRFNLLLCSTIIESGIDIPSANTIIINRADRLGLAQLHQLRGRVGRSYHQAYAYLFALSRRTLTADAIKRLEAIEALEALGSGFTLATHDLEIRGAGELLGEEQSGQIQAIGFTLYNEFLTRAVKSLRAGKEPDLLDPYSQVLELDLGLTALIPDHYIPDVHMRLVQYKRIANADSQEALRELQVEFVDRFGLLPSPTRTLFKITRLKLLAHQLGVAKIQAGLSGGQIRFGEHSTMDPLALLSLVEDQSEDYRLNGPFKLRFKWDQVLEEDRIRALEMILTRLGAHKTN